ncbi:MAG: universal stress protein [Acidimicrobiales bacterium]
MERIVVGMDESASAADALRWAVAEGALRGWPVTAVLAWTYLEQHQVLEGVEDFDPEYSEADATEALAVYVERAVGAAAAAGVDKVVVMDRAAHGLLDLAGHAALLVVGARGLGGFRGLVVGSVSQQVLHHATCPVAVVKTAEGTHTRRGRVVVAVDGSDTSRSALDWALDEARARGAALDVVHCCSTPPYYGYPYVPPLDFEALEESGRAMLDDMLGAADTTGLTEAPTPIVRMGGSIADTILDVAKDADLVVVGARGLGGFQGMLLGSVSQHVVHRAACEVVVIPLVHAAAS